VHDLIRTNIAVIGAGPIGLEVAIALKRHGLDYLHFEAGQAGQVILDFPFGMRFFSSNERISIGGLPVQSASHQKCTREEYLAYLRQVVRHFGLDVRTYEPVMHARREDDHFVLQTRSSAGNHVYLAERIVLATGGTAKPRRLNVPGEDLPHVSHAPADPHTYFQRRVLVVGGRNSAVETALRCHDAAARVTVSYRGPSFHERVKYWLKPEIESLVKDGEVEAIFNTRPVEITPTHATLEHVQSRELTFVPADFVLLLIGYVADMRLFEMLGVALEGEERAPKFDERTMETNVRGVYVAGTATGGTQSRFRVYMENSHIHAQRIVAAILGRKPPKATERWSVPES